jgi:hypothetical protein
MLHKGAQSESLGFFNLIMGVSLDRLPKNVVNGTDDEKKIKKNTNCFVFEKNDTIFVAHKGKNH